MSVLSGSSPMRNLAARAPVGQRGSHHRSRLRAVCGAEEVSDFVEQDFEPLGLGNHLRPFAHQQVRGQRPADAAQVRVAAEEGVLAGETDCQPFVLERHAALEFFERLGKIVNAVVRFPSADVDHLKADSTIASKNFRGVGNPAAKPLFPNRARRAFVLVDQDLHRHDNRPGDRGRIERLLVRPVPIEGRKDQGRRGNAFTQADGGQRGAARSIDQGIGGFRTDRVGAVLLAGLQGKAAAGGQGQRQTVAGGEPEITLRRTALGERKRDRFLAPVGDHRDRGSSSGSDGENRAANRYSQDVGSTIHRRISGLLSLPEQPGDGLFSIRRPRAPGL